MIVYLHFLPEDKLKVTTKGPFVRFEVGEENFEVHCIDGCASFVEQLREQTDLLVREEARIAAAAQERIEREKQAAPSGQGDVVA